MDALKRDLGKISKTANLAKSVDETQQLCDLLTKARNEIAADPSSASIILAKLQNPTKKSFESLNDSLKAVHKGLNEYSKSLDKTFKDKPLPSTENANLSSRTFLINRAIAMHLLREGEFSVASTFLTEATTADAHPHIDGSLLDEDSNMDRDQSFDTLQSEALQASFTEMYSILHELKQSHNLVPAIQWARANSQLLEARGSNLEFELNRLQFVWLFLGANDDSGMHSTEIDRHQALQYARSQISRFNTRYLREVQQLGGAMAFSSNLGQSPYQSIFHNPSAWDDVANAFTREYCSLLGLSADSPLHIAATAGAIALPTLLKLQTIMKTKRTEWTTQDELPVEIALPPAYQFHSIFVCPVSKEQSTDANPPMMMPCGHVVCRESLMRLSKGSKFKCPYCPGESHPRDCMKVVL